MKTGIKTAVIVATVFAGTLVVEAQQQRTQQQKGQPSGNRIHQCPNCGWSPQRQQGRGDAQIQGQRSQQRQQFRREDSQQPDRRNAQVQGQRSQQRRQFQNQTPQHQGRPQWSPEQRQQAMQQRQQFWNQNQQQPNRQFQTQQGRNRIQQNPQQQQQIQQRRQQMLKRFDADGDGQLSEAERKQLKKSWKQHKKNNGTEGRQERPPQPAKDNN